MATIGLIKTQRIKFGQAVPLAENGSVYKNMDRFLSIFLLHIHIHSDWLAFQTCFFGGKLFINSLLNVSFPKAYSLSSLMEKAPVWAPYPSLLHTFFSSCFVKSFNFRIDNFHQADSRVLYNDTTSVGAIYGVSEHCFANKARVLEWRRELWLPWKKLMFINRGLGKKKLQYLFLC